MLNTADSVTPDTQLTSTNMLETPIATPSPNPQSAPTPDATVAALQKRQLQDQVNQLENQPSWLEKNSPTLIATGITAGTIIASVYGIVRNQRTAQEQQRDQLFQNALEGLGSERDETKATAATMLLTFLRSKGYDRFYQQIFDIAVAYFRGRDVKYDDEGKPQVRTLDQAFVPILIEAAGHAYKLFNRTYRRTASRMMILDASGVHLDGVDFQYFDLRAVKMDRSTFTNVHLLNSNLRDNNLGKANLTGAMLLGANLRETSFYGANLTEAFLLEANLTRATFINANLTRTFLAEANLKRADFDDAILTKTILKRANLKGANPEKAASLEGALMFGVKGLTPEQIAKCKEKGADFDSQELPEQERERLQKAVAYYSSG